VQTRYLVRWHGQDGSLSGLPTRWSESALYEKDLVITTMAGSFPYVYMLGRCGTSHQQSDDSPRDTDGHQHPAPFRRQSTTRGTEAGR
jgi:hypothetical protein